MRRIITHIDAGLEVEEILDLWNVAFPGHHWVWYDEEEGLIHIDEHGATVGEPE